MRDKTTDCRNKNFGIVAVTLLLILTGFSRPVWPADTVYRLTLPAASAPDTLDELAEETGHSLFYPSDEISSFNTNSLDGSYTLPEALDVLLKGIPLSAVVTQRGVIVVSVAPEAKDKSSEEDKNMDAKKGLMAAVAGFLFGAGGAKGVVAQDVHETSTKNSRYTIEEVMVTAQKREENVQDISIVVDAFSGQALSNMGVGNTADISNLSAGVVISNMTGDSTPTISIRGVGVGGASYFANQPNSASLNVDGVYLPSAIMSNFQIFDISSVEVLKGPQGTLYGRNSTAGAINFYANKPTEEFSGYAGISYSRWNTVRAEGAVSGPLSDKVLYRLASVYDYSDGNVENAFTGNDVNGADRLALRGSLAFGGSDNTDVLLTAHYGRDKSDIFHYQTQPAENPGNGLDRFAYEAPCINTYTPADIGCLSSSQSLAQSSSAYDGDNFLVNDNLEDEGDAEAYGATLTIEHDFVDTALTSISAYNGFTRYYAEDADGGPTTELHIYFDEDFDTFSQELRLASVDDSPFQWIAGAYYSKLDASMGRAADFTDLGTAAYGGGYGIVYANELDEEAWALFGHTTYRITDTVELIAGVRYSEETKEIYVVSSNFGDDARLMAFSDIMALSPNCDDFRTPPLGCVSGATSPFGPQKQSWDNLSGKLGLQWDVNDDMMTYAHYSRGFKSGGFPGTIGVRPNRIVPYSPEKVDAYEVGTKVNFAGGAGRFNAAAFFLDYKDKQEYANFPGESVAFDFVNAGQSEIKGVEFQLGYSFPFDARLDMGMAYIDAEYTDFLFDDTPGSIDDRSGYRMPYAPEVTGNISYSQFFELGGERELEIFTNLSYTDEQYFDSGERLAFSAADYVLWNARAKFYFGSQTGLTVSVFVENITNEEYRAGGVDQATGQYGLSYGKQRSFGLEVHKEW